MFITTRRGKPVFDAPKKIDHEVGPQKWVLLPPGGGLVLISPKQPLLHNMFHAHLPVTGRRNHTLWVLLSPFPAPITLPPPNPCVPPSGSQWPFTTTSPPTSTFWKTASRTSPPGFGRAASVARLLYLNLVYLCIFIIYYIILHYIIYLVILVFVFLFLLKPAFLGGGVFWVQAKGVFKNAIVVKNTSL